SDEIQSRAWRPSHNPDPELLDELLVRVDRRRPARSRMPRPVHERIVHDVLQELAAIPAIARPRAFLEKVPSRIHPKPAKIARRDRRLVPFDLARYPPIGRPGRHMDLLEVLILMAGRAEMTELEKTALHVHAMDAPLAAFELERAFAGEMAVETPNAG